VKGKFLSKTQYNFKRQELERLMEEREIYEARIKEANKMLANIGKKAEEAKANPEWLK
jgi:chaperonin cofactor prefoldin